MTRTLLLLALLTAAGPALGLNMRGFREAPITRLTEEELKAFRAVVMKTLDETPDGTTVEWKAPRTPFVSRISPRKSYSSGKLPCREATIESDTGDRFQRGLYTFCKSAKGEWQFSRPAGQKAR